jgi:hypothetical protein
MFSLPLEHARITIRTSEKTGDLRFSPAFVFGVAFGFMAKAWYLAAGVLAASAGA